MHTSIFLNVLNTCTVYPDFMFNLTSNMLARGYCQLCSHNKFQNNILEFIVAAQLTVAIIIYGSYVPVHYNFARI